MRYRKFLLFFLLTIFCSTTFAAVFVVTSNADSGPGTLRDALTQAGANGTAEKDFINFNLPDLSEAGRTILLASKLPDLSSNLVIDGSTQPGAVLGVSTSRVSIFFNAPIQENFSGFNILNQNDIEIFGICLKNLTNYHNAQILQEPIGIEIVNSNNIQIGDVQKGNVVSGFRESLVDNPISNELRISSNIVLKSNFFGVDNDGETFPGNSNFDGYVSLFFVTDNITCGGTSAEGNIFAGGLEIGYDGYAKQTTILIKNNKINLDYTGTIANAFGGGLNLSSVDPSSNTIIHIEDNILCCEQGSAALFAGNMGGTLTILRNYVGVTLSGKPIGAPKYGIFLTSDSVVQIGSNNLADANYIGYCTPITSGNCQKLSFNKNSIFCKPFNTLIYSSDSFGQSHVQCDITNISSIAVTGTATPNSNIELFYSDRCQTCSPETYFASVTADANGNWSYNGPISGTVIASATLNEATSEFTRTNINTDNIKVLNACNGTGSITGAVTRSAVNVKWVDINNKVVGTGADLLNVKIGKYKLFVSNGACGDSTSYFEIKNRFQIDSTQIKIVQPSCSNLTGSISGINVINNEAVEPSSMWQDASGKVISNTADLEEAAPGSYYFIITSSDNMCSQKFGPFTLKNTAGPNIDQSKASITPTNCGQTVGSITGITATGTGNIKYSWQNSQQQEVATTADLLNQPAGTYTLKVTDDTQCGPIYSAAVVIPELNGIAIDESNAKTTIASCSKNNGSITGISATGATQYQWNDGANNVVGTSVDLTNVTAGSYTLTVSNNFGCSNRSKTYSVTQQAATQFPAYNSTITSACYNLSNGIIVITGDALVKSVRWVNSQAQTIGNDLTIKNLFAGDYQLYLTDQNGCENFYKTYTVPQLDALAIAIRTEQIVNDQCSLKTGSVSGIQISGGLPPYSYSWLDSNAKEIATTINISGLGAGEYTLNVTDATNCFKVATGYPVSNINNDTPTPDVSNIQVCSPETVTLQVKNTSLNYEYRLYDSETSTTVIDSQATGKFKISAKANRSYYVSQASGSCESARAEVKIIVGLSAVDIANAFTPNNDGINDYWKITGIENYPDATIQVFARSGQLIYNSKGYAKPFDGTYNGKNLPVGVYYYMINLSTNCNILSGSLTIIR